MKKCQVVFYLENGNAGLEKLLPRRPWLSSAI